MSKLQGVEPPEPAAGVPGIRNEARREDSAKDPQVVYVLGMLKKQEEELLARRRYLPIVLGDEHDREHAGIPVLGIGVLLVEAGWAFYFLRHVMMWPDWLSAAVTIGVLGGSALGLKQILDSQYLRAQDASTAVRHMLIDDKEDGQ